MADHELDFPIQVNDSNEIFEFWQSSSHQVFLWVTPPIDPNHISLSYLRARISHSTLKFAQASLDVCVPSITCRLLCARFHVGSYAIFPFHFQNLSDARKISRINELEVMQRERVFAADKQSEVDSWHGCIISASCARAIVGQCTQPKEAIQVRRLPGNCFSSWKVSPLFGKMWKLDDSDCDSLWILAIFGDTVIVKAGMLSTATLVNDEP